MLNKLSWKIIIFSPVNEWRTIAFASHKITNVGYVKNIFKVDTFWRHK